MKSLDISTRGRRPEMAFVLRALRHGGDAGAMPDSAALDWDYVLHFAFRHRLLPVLHARLAAPDMASVPDAVRTKIHERTTAISRNNLLLAAELLRITSDLERDGIPVLPFKGATLAVRLYGSIAARFFTDNDILVPYQYASRAWGRLRELGYEPRPPLTEAQARVYPRYEHDIGMWHAYTNAHAELHWRLFDRGIVFDLGDDLWARLERRPFLGTDVLMLPAEELLLVLAVHGGKHGWSQLGWAYDVAQLIAVEPGLDWENVFRMAARSGCRRMLHLAVLLATGFFGVQVPAAVADIVAADRHAQRLADDVARRIFVADDDTFDGRPAQRFYLALRERMGDRLRYLWHWAVTPNARDRYGADLAPGLSFLYYGLRPLRRLAGLVGRPRKGW